VIARAAEVRGAGSKPDDDDCSDCVGGACDGGACDGGACDGGAGTGCPPGPGAGMLPAALYPFGGGSAAGEGILCA